MNKKKTFYLAHNFYDRKELREWELNIEKKHNINLDNPFYDNDRNDIKALDAMKDHSPEQAKYFRERNTPEMCEGIVEGDLEMIRKADGLLTIIKSASIGTSMEIFFASRVLRIPVYVITENYRFHPWIQKFAARVFLSRYEFELWLNREMD